MLFIYFLGLYFPSSELTNFSSNSESSTLSIPTLTQDHGPDHGVDADQAERDARELTTAFQHALSNNSTNLNVDDDAMDVDSDTYNCEGEGEDGDEVGLVDPQMQSAKEWVCVCTYGMYYHHQTYTTSY
jgi:hypothetical protein